MDANGGYYPTYDHYRSFGSTSDPESSAASIYGGGSAQSRFDDELLELGDWMEDDPSTLMADSVGYAQSSTQGDHQVVQLSGSSLQQQYENTVIRESGKKEKIAFKTKSDIEILDDGFKWRKYGKKMVKNSPNPRNYYRCSVEGCPVKKRVERDKEDYKYVITTYEGTHNHEGTSKF